MGEMRALYACPIHEAAASGDLRKMKKIADEAQEYLRQSGDVSAALQALKIEIAKAERKG